jgi:hypothetical protein
MTLPVYGRRLILGRGLETGFRCKTQRLPGRLQNDRFMDWAGKLLLNHQDSLSVLYFSFSVVTRNTFAQFYLMWTPARKFSGTNRTTLTHSPSSFSIRVSPTARNKRKDIEMLECMIMSDEALTYAQSLLLKQWRLEPLSLREEPQDPMMQE